MIHAQQFLTTIYGRILALYLLGNLLMNQTKTYKVALARRLPWMIIVPILTIIPVGMTLIILIASISQPNFGGIGTLLCALVPLFIFMIPIGIVLAPSAIAGYTTSYLRLSPEGLDCNLLPMLRHQCQWNDLDRLDKFNNFDVLYLKQSITTGSPFWRWFYRTTSPTKQPYISLTIFNEWPNGELATELHNYAPQLFEG